jgi:glyoxylate/hydroxypyruvate reductase A
VDEVFGPKDLSQVIPRVDFLITALPLTSETHHLLGEKELSLMKEGDTLFSVGRGETIDEAAMIKILKTGKIQAVLDVFDREPLPKESELWSLKNVIVTPHVSGITPVQEVCEEFIANYQRWEKGEPLLGLIDRIKGY